MSKQGCKTLRKMLVFMALFPPLRALPLVPSTVDAPRESLSRAPFLSPLVPVAFSPPPGSSSLCPPIAAVSRSARRFLLPLARRCASPCISPFSAPPCPLRHPHSITPLGPWSRGGPHHRRARTAGRDCPHRRGHHFNVTLIKSNNQYLPRKKF